MFTYIYFKGTWFLKIFTEQYWILLYTYILKVPLKSKFDVLTTVEIRIQNFSVRLQTMFINIHVWGGGNWGGLEEG